VTRNTVRSYVGVTIVVSHFLILAGVLIAPYWSVLTWKESVGFAQVIAPLFAGFTTAIVKYFMKNPWAVTLQGKRKVSFPYVVVSFLPTIAFVVLLTVIVIAYASNHSPADFEQTRTAIVGLEG
jgi:hypothetical protein